MVLSSEMVAVLLHALGLSNRNLECVQLIVGTSRFPKSAYVCDVLAKLQILFVNISLAVFVGL